MNKRRFIAGAVCPQCRQQDRIVMFTCDGVDGRQCVNCGFEEQKNFLNVTKELPTRVNQSPSPDWQGETSVVKVVGVTQKEKNSKK